MERSNASEPTKVARAFSLRPYQRRAIDDARMMVRAGNRAVLIVAPTGAGKTVVGVAIALRHLAASPHNRVLWLAHRRELVKQAAERVQRDGLRADQLRVIQAADVLGDPDAPVTIASIQTLLSERWQSKLPVATLVIFDEAHHLAAEEWSKLAEHYAPSLRIGLTATPERADGSPLGDIFTGLVVVASIRELIAGGHLVPCTVFAPSEYQSALASDPVDAYAEHGSNRPAVVFCSNVEHAKQTAEAFTSRGYQADYIDGTMAKGRRSSVLHRHANGELPIVCNVAVLTEGWDCPTTSVCVLARGCQHASMYLQIVGRVLRTHESKTEATLIDLRGVVWRHGLVEADREYSLEGQAIRLGTKTPPLKQCKACGAVFTPVRVCPVCGVESANPELPEIRRARLMAISEAHTTDQRKAYWDKLVQQAKERGYRSGWAHFRYVARYGVKPNFAAAS